MTRQYLIFLLKLGLVGALVVLISSFYGNIRLDILDWRIEMPFALGVGLLLILLYVMIKLDHLWLFVRAVPAKYRQHKQQKRQMNGMHALTQGLLAAAAGDASTTLKQAKLAESLIGDQDAVRLLKAQSAQLLGNHKAAHDFFTELSKDKNHRIAGLVGLMQLALSENTPSPPNALPSNALPPAADGETNAPSPALHQQMRALDYAEKICAIEPNHPVAAPKLIELAMLCGQWDIAERGVLRARKTQKNQRRITQMDRTLAEIYYQQALQESKQNQTDAALEKLKKLIKLDPAHLAGQRFAANLLLKQGQQRAAKQIIKDLWRASPDCEAGEIYLSPKLGINENKTESALERLKRVKSLIALHPNHIESKLLYVKALIAADIWGEARTILLELIKEISTQPATSKPVITRHHAKRIYGMLAQLELAQHNDQTKANHWLMQNHHFE